MHSFEEGTFYLPLDLAKLKGKGYTIEIYFQTIEVELIWQDPLFY